MSYKAEIIADSTNQFGDRITTFVVTYPRIIHAEMCRHRMLSRNTASSRAIPFKKMVKDVEENPFIPIAWQKNHKGMQGTEYLTDLDDINGQVDSWLKARNEAVHYATELNVDGGVTKQLCNRLLEPFVWTTEIITGTEWENFFNLRCPRYKTQFGIFLSKKDAIIAELDITGKNSNTDTLQSPWIDDTISWLQINESQADIHIQAIAELMWDAYNESTPKQLKAGEWHIPFGDNFDEERLWNIVNSEEKDRHLEPAKVYYGTDERKYNLLKIKIATARCARISYKNFEGKDDYEADIKLHNRLASMKHWSPFEHCAKAMNYDKFYTFKQGYNSRTNQVDNDDKIFGWCKNFKSWINYRHLIEG